MIASTDHKLYQKMIKKGKDGILQTIRANKGAGKGLIAGAIVLLVFTLPASILLLTDSSFVAAVILSAPGLILLVWGIYLAHKRTTDWISYYQKETGFSEEEILQINQELSSPSVTIVTCQVPNAVVESFIAAYFTEHYLVMDSIEPYVRRLEDIIAVAFSDSTDSWRMAALSTQDQETRGVALFTDTQRKKTLCMEVMQELRRRNPKVLCGQEIVCDGNHYILELDGAQLLRLYQEGRTLESAR